MQQPANGLTFPHLPMTLDERFDDIAELVPAIVWVTNAGGEFVYVNARWTEFTALPRQRDRGEGWREAMHPEDRARIGALVEAAMMEGESFSVEYRVRRSDGAYRWMLDRGTPRTSPAGTFLGYVGTVVDITERKVAEESLRWSESRFRALAAAAPHMMWALTLDGSIQHLNDRVTLVTGRAPKQAHIGRWLSIIHPDDVRVTLRAWARAMRNRTVLEVEHRLLHHSGNYCWHLSRAVPHRDELGSIRLWYGTSTDINELKAVERALRESRERLDAALAASQSGTYRWDIQRDIVDWDENLYAVFGRDRRDRVRRVDDIVPMVHPDDRALVMAGVERIVREGLDYIHEFRVIHPNGRTHWLANRSVVTRDADGAPAFLTGACSDITTRKTAELALQEAKNDSERSNLAKDRFLAVLSHELRTPLNPVKMILDMLSGDDRIDDDLRALIDTARRNVDMQARLIDDLLDVTRIASGKLRMQRLEVRLHDVLREVVEVCRGEIDKKQLRVSIDLNAADDVLVADPERLTQVFWNLVRNAAKFTPQDGSIAIATSGDVGRIRVDIADSGVGVPPDDLQRIFELFAQSHTLVQRRQGLGLGLAISRSIVELHGGTIAAYSEGEGRGTTFSVELPLACAAADVRGRGRGRLRVMLVEDDDALREAVSMWLEARGYAVVQAASAEEALRLAQGIRIEVLVSDLYLPNATGLDLMRQLRRQQTVHGIAMSGSGDASDVALCLDAGFSSYLVKPLDLDRLLGEIDELARRIALP